MGAKPGEHLGGISDLASLRLRCVCDHGDDACWHLRTARGRPMPRGGKAHVVWVFGRGTVTATRIAWEYHTGRKVPKNMRVIRTCESYDCVNPAHLKQVTAVGLLKAKHKDGSYDTPARRATVRLMREARGLLMTDELRQWVMESSQSSYAIAHALGTVQSWINTVRHQERAKRATLAGAASVFQAGERLAA